MPKALNLTKQQRNDLFKVAVQHRVDPARILWSSIPAASNSSSETAKLTIKDKGHEFFFTLKLNTENKFYCTFSPRIGMAQSAILFQWEKLVEQFREWMKVVAYELQEPDLWVEIPENPMLASNPESYSHEEKFSSAEATLIKERLRKIEEFIVEKSGVVPADATKIHQTFIYLENKVETSSKMDWKNIFVSEIVGLVAGYAVEHYAAIITFCNTQLLPFFKEVLKLH